MVMYFVYFGGIEVNLGRSVLQGHPGGELNFEQNWCWPSPTLVTCMHDGDLDDDSDDGDDGDDGLGVIQQIYSMLVLSLF